MPTVSPAVIALALLCLNAATFAVFGFDKIRAEGGGRRVSEARLLQIALIGGTPGAYAARAVFRHKTRKQPFSGRLRAIAVLQGLAVIGGLGWAWLA